jgi:hypothetical protein
VFGNYQGFEIGGLFLDLEMARLERFSRSRCHPPKSNATLVSP